MFSRIEGTLRERGPDSALVEAGGGKVVVVEGERRNLKLTRADDLEMAQTLMEGGRS